ncbi:outer membrane efflux protein [Galbibacter marinus]|uniref:Outer membrane efflux protein n=2 Tax=Galbibacter marinus TaxID=555500 RepID=K2QLN7_9FLAO|nr:outer membrane efflux protein [Galbibacter marinus]
MKLVKLTPMSSYKYIIVLLFGTCSILGYSQEILSAEQAISLALENNYEIRMAKNELSIDSLSHSAGFSGMLPRVNAFLDDNNSIQNLEQTRSDGTVNSQDDAKNNSLNYGLELGWTLFDGFKMFATHERLKEQINLGSNELKEAIINNLSEVLITYYDLVQQQQQLAALDSTVVISKQRVTLAQNRFDIGKASKLEVLNAEVDLNTDQTLFLEQKELYANTKVVLNRLLARDINANYTVAPEIKIDSGLFLPDLEAMASENNPQLLSYIIQNKIAKLKFKEIRASRYPTVIATTSYNFSESESSLGFTTNSSSHGLRYGVGVNLNIFDGFNQNRSEKIAKLRIDNSKLLIEQQEKTLLAQLSVAHKTYLTNLQLIALEHKNESMAKENLEITMEKYRIGIIPTIEFRTAQLNYINAQLRHSNAIFKAKLSEISLKALSGILPM